MDEATEGPAREHVYSYDEQGRLFRDGVAMPKGSRMPPPPPVLNPDGSRTTRRDTRAFANDLVGLSKAAVANRAEADGRFKVYFYALDTPRPAASTPPFTIIAEIDDAGRVARIETN